MAAARSEIVLISRMASASSFPSNVHDIASSPWSHQMTMTNSTQLKRDCLEALLLRLLRTRSQPRPKREHIGKASAEPKKESNPRRGNAVRSMLREK